MSYVSEKYSKKTNSYDYKPKDCIYKNLKELFEANGKEAKYTVLGLYLAEKGKYPHPCAAIENNIMVDFPPYMMDDVKEMRKDSVLTDLINKKLVGFTIHTYESDKRKELCYGVDFIDLDDQNDDLPFEVN